jgi:hypothetical protein
MMWSSETLAMVSRLFDPLELPDKLLIRPVQGFLQLIGRENAARITSINFRITLTPFGPRLRGSSTGYVVATFIEDHNLIFNDTLTGLKELRITGYWGDSLGKPAFAKNHSWHDSPNYRQHLQNSDDLLSNQVFCKLTKNVETFVKRVPQDTSVQPHRCSSICT